MRLRVELAFHNSLCIGGLDENSVGNAPYLHPAASGIAANDKKEEDRVKESGVVLKEIFNIPDDIPHEQIRSQVAPVDGLMWMAPRP